MKNLLFILILFPGITFSQKDSTRIRDQFYLELNGGLGIFKYVYNFSSPSGNYSEEMAELSMGASASFQYRNHRWNIGVSTGYLLVLESDGDPYLSFETGINLLSKTESYKYFGPSFSFGLIKQDPGYLLGKSFIEFGFDAYFKKFHIGLKHQWFARENEIYFKTINTTNLYLELGYAFNIESFRKKK